MTEHIEPHCPSGLRFDDPTSTPEDAVRPEVPVTPSADQVIPSYVSEVLGHTCETQITAHWQRDGTEVANGPGAALLDVSEDIFEPGKETFDGSDRAEQDKPYDQVGWNELMHYLHSFRTDDTPEKLQEDMPWANWTHRNIGEFTVWIGDFNPMRRCGGRLVVYYDPEDGLHTAELSLGFDTLLGMIEPMWSIAGNCVREDDRPSDNIGSPISKLLGVDRVVIEDSWWRSQSGRYQIQGDFRADMARYDGSPAKSGCFLRVKRFLT